MPTVASRASRQRPQAGPELRCVPTALNLWGCKSSPLLIGIDCIFKQFLKTQVDIPVPDTVESGHVWILSRLWTKKGEKFVTERA